MAADRGDFTAGWEEDPINIDHTVAHASRVYDYLLGGVDNFSSDREAAAQLGAVLGGIDNPKRDVRANRNFLGRAVRYLVLEAGIRQFLDIGTGVPNADNTHAVAQELAPESRVVYVDNDDIVLAHAHTLLRGKRDRTAYLKGDLRQPDDILERAAETLDFDQPIAVMLVSVMHFIDPDDDPTAIVSKLRDAVVPSSYLTLSHLTKDIQPEETMQAAAVISQATRENFNLRTHSEITSFFGDYEMVEPGLVQVDRWHPESEDDVPDDESRQAPFYAGMGLKP